MFEIKSYDNRNNTTNSRVVGDTEEPCISCKKPGVLDTGWECTACGFDNMPHYWPRGVKAEIY